MPDIIAHIIGLDDITKEEFTRSLPKSISVLDLDNIQQKIYNNKNLRDAKQKWSDISNKINAMNRQKRLLEKNGIEYDSLLVDIKELMVLRAQSKSHIYDLWKHAFNEEINSFVSRSKTNMVLIGFNIYAKDYRQKVNLPMNNYYIETNNKTYFNKIIIDTSATSFAENQISYYLNQYRQKIIAGTFPLYLLDKEYLKSKYDKFVSYYLNQGYNRLSIDDNIKELIDFIVEIEKQMNTKDIIIYYATIFKASCDSKTIPVSKAIEGYTDRTQALSHIREKMITMKRKSPIYLYQLRGEAFKNIEGKYIAIKPADIVKEEVLIEDTNTESDSTIDKLLNAITITSSNDPNSYNQEKSVCLLGY